MPNYSPVKALCRRAGRCQAGLGAETGRACAPHAPARGMAFCKRIRNAMMKNAHMTRMRLSDYRGSPASVSENFRNRQFSETEAESPGACNDGSKWMNANNKACQKHGACHKSCSCTCGMPFNTKTDSSSGVSKDTLFPRKTRSARPQNTCQGHRITLPQWCMTRLAATAVPKCMPRKRQNHRTKRK